MQDFSSPPSGLAHFAKASLRLAALAAVTRARKPWVTLQRLSTRSSAIDPPLSRRIIYAGYSLQECFASTTNDAHPQINLFRAAD